MSSPRDRRRQPGFTLGVGILVAIPLYANVQARARLAKAQP